MDKKPERNFFPGPFNPKYKDINLFDSERESQPIKDYYNIQFERGIERKKNLKIIKKYKKEELRNIKFYLN
jgi:hypothetical protein